MVRWILSLTALCVVSATLGFGKFLPLASTAQSLWLVVFAVSATLLIGAFEAYETQVGRADTDEG